MWNGWSSGVSKFKFAAGQLIPVRGQIQLEYSIAKHSSREHFVVIPSTNSIILGNLFFKNNSIELYPKENRMKLQYLTLH